MTTRNFRVHNGISVGDIVISASANTITGLTTAAPSADGDVANKKYVDDAVSSLSSTTITEGNSSVIVADSGTGSITATVDGATVATFQPGDLALPNNVGVLFGTGGEKIESDGTDLTVTSTGLLDLTATGLTSITNNAYVGGTLSVQGITEFATDVHVLGNLNVAGTETIFNSQSLTIEDNIISLNTNISNSATMPRWSGMHIHRGSGSSPTELDIYMTWDDQYDVVGSTTNLGGTFSFFGSIHQDGVESPGSDHVLADIRCSVIEAVATSAQYADIAERFAADAPITPGAVVMLGGSQEITETAEDLSDKVFGVVSTQPAYMMNSGAGNNDSHPYVAMTGRTPVRVTGTVNKGDRLVSSSVKGTARAASADETINPFHVIGRALEDKFDDAIGLVNCVVRTNN